MKMSARGENGQNEKTHVRMQGRVSHGQTDTSSKITICSMARYYLQYSGAVGGGLEQIIIFISCRNNVDALQIQIIFA